MKKIVIFLWLMIKHPLTPKENWSTAVMRIELEGNKDFDELLNRFEL